MKKNKGEIRYQESFLERIYNQDEKGKKQEIKNIKNEWIKGNGFRGGKRITKEINERSNRRRKEPKK